LKSVKFDQKTLKFAITVNLKTRTGCSEIQLRNAEILPTVNNINQLWVQAQTAHDAADWSLLTQYLQDLISNLEGFKQPEIAPKRQQLLEFSLSVLHFGDFHLRWDIAKIFRRLGKIAIDPLIDILEDGEGDEELRWYAARLLGELKYPEAIEALVALLKNSNNEELKAMASSALGQIGTPAIESLGELLASPDSRLLAVRALYYIRHTQTLPMLLSVVEDSQVLVRATAIEALGSFHDQRIPLVLLKALDDVAPSVRREAIVGLGFRRDLCDELDLVNKLQPKLYDTNLDVCCAAAVSISRMGGDAAAQALFQVLISYNTKELLQLEIIRALAWIGNESGLEYLGAALKELKSVKLVREITTVLGRVQQPGFQEIACDILLESLDTGNQAIDLPYVKQSLALSLGQLGCKQAKDILISLLADKDTGVRLHAVAALKNMD
jgi:HEAT repeat protein